MTSIVLPAPTSTLPPAAYLSSPIGAGFERLQFELEPSPMASLVTVSAWLRGSYSTLGFKTPHAILSITGDGGMLGCAGDGYADHAEFFILSTSASVRVEPDKRRFVTISLEQTRFTVEYGHCTLARLAVTF